MEDRILFLADPVPGQQTKAGVDETPNQHGIPVIPACETSAKYEDKLNLKSCWPS